MNRSNSTTKRLFAFMVAFIMMFAVIPTNVFAAYRGPSSEADALNYLLYQLQADLDGISTDTSLASLQSRANKKLADIKKDVANTMEDLGAYVDLAIDLTNALKGGYNAYKEFNTNMTTFSITTHLHAEAIAYKVGAGNTVIDLSANISDAEGVVITSLSMIKPDLDDATTHLDQIKEKRNLLLKMAGADGADPTLSALQSAYAGSLKVLEDILTDILNNMSDVAQHSEFFGKGTNKNLFYSKLNAAVTALKAATKGKEFAAVTSTGGILLESGQRITLTSLSLTDLVDANAEATLFSQFATATHINLVQSFARSLTVTTTKISKADDVLKTAKTEYGKYAAAIASATVEVTKAAGLNKYYISVAINGTVKKHEVTITAKTLATPALRLDYVKTFLQSTTFRLSPSQASQSEAVRCAAVKTLVTAEIPEPYKSAGKTVVVEGDVLFIEGSYYVVLKDTDSSQKTAAFKVNVSTTATKTPLEQVQELQNLITTEIDGIVVPVENQLDVVAYIKECIASVTPAGNETEVGVVAKDTNGNYTITLTNGSALSQFSIKISLDQLTSTEQMAKAVKAITDAAKYVVPSDEDVAAYVKAKIEEALSKVPGVKATVNVKKSGEKYMAALTVGTSPQMVDDMDITALIDIRTAKGEFDAVKAAIKAASDAGEFEIPVANQTDQKAKTDWVQSVVDAILEDLDDEVTDAQVLAIGAPITYYVQLKNGTESETLTLAVTEESSSKNGWVNEKGVYYYYEDNVAAEGWREFGVLKYYFNAGVPVKGWDDKIDGKWRLFNSTNGDMVTGPITFQPGQTPDFSYYFDLETGIVKMDWFQVGDDWYCANTENGTLIKGWWVIDANTKLYFDKTTGKAFVNGTFEVPGEGSFVFDANGFLVGPAA